MISLTRPALVLSIQTLVCALAPCAMHAEIIPATDIGQVATDARPAGDPAAPLSPTPRAGTPRQLGVGAGSKVDEIDLPQASGIAGAIRVRDVLHSVIEINRAPAQPLTPASPAPRRADGRDVALSQSLQVPSLTEAILDSETLGEMLRGIVKRSAEGDGKTLSLLGIGLFSIDASPDSRTFTLHEHTTGAVIQLSKDVHSQITLGKVELAGPSSPAENSDAYGQPKITIEAVLTFIWGSLFSPLGLLVLTLLLCVGFAYAALRLGAFLQRVRA